ncbi:peptidylprolyl isomerase [uncultured Clostridium sp.]|uniref:peptidylprolyl isomerase n=1 Tax=uncultured Clostridium sp. TaxID=59620 RepID=UPI0028E62698|nr:peptidylprolyl isomerase [uncultured Clostridium sp.]
MKNVKKIIISSLVTLMTFSAVGCSMVEKTPEAIKKSVVAKVNNETITREELDSNPIVAEQLEGLKEQYGENYINNSEVKEQLLEFKKQMVEQMATEKLILQKSKDFKIDESKVNEEVEKTLNDVIESSFNNDKEKFVEELKKMGITEAQLKDFYKTQMIITEVRDSIVKDVKVTDEAAKKQYDENIYQFLEKESKFHAAHILVSTEEEAKKVKERLDKGEDFAKVAQEVSTDGSKENGGDLGEAGYGDFVKPFVDAVVKLNKGEISGPVKSDYGYHIIKLIDKEPITIKKFDTVKEEIKEELLSSEQQKKFNSELESWKKESKIETEKYTKNLI